MDINIERIIGPGVLIAMSIAYVGPAGVSGGEDLHPTATLGAVPYRGARGDLGGWHDLFSFHSYH